MASLRHIRKRIRSVASTQKITKAMKMVAAARLRRSQQKVADAIPYARKIEELMKDLAGEASESGHPYLRSGDVKRRVLVVLSSDRGLCGAFNSNLFRMADREVRSETTTSVVPIGKKATSYFARRQVSVYKQVPNFWPKLTYESARELFIGLASDFCDGTIDRVDVLYSEYLSVISQRPIMKTVLPLAQPAAGAESHGVERIYEPSRVEILKALISRSVEIQFYLACLHSQASEYGARMTAMDSATRNAVEMIDTLTLDMNRARQAAITRELVEIISGAEALK